MIEDTSPANGRLYVYVTNWDKYRPRRDRPNYDWLQLHTSLLGNDAWLELSCPDRCLLISIWMLAQRYGNGRLKADERWLKSQAKAHKSSLQRLIDAGWVSLSTTKAEPPGSRMVGLEEKRREKEEKERSAQGAKAPADFLENGRRRITAERAAELARINREEMGGPA
jgi:hypothetical protein